MKRLAYALVSFVVFLWEFINIVMIMQFMAFKHMAHGFMHALIQYHNRIQDWADDGKSLFEVEEFVEDEE